MAQLFYRYSVMSAGKSLDLLKVRFNYKEKKRRVLTLTCGKSRKIVSRAGLEQVADYQITKNYKEFSLFLFDTLQKEDPKCSVVLVDEAQFLTENEVIVLASVVDDYGIPVICYGLKNDFQNNLFEGSKALLEYADKIEEIKTICEYCNRKATMNLRLDEKGNPVTDGKQIVYAKDRYVSVCRKHYFKAREKK